MKRWQGFSPRLGTPMDLMTKLEHDLARLAERPDDDYAAWDFFVTAEHMRDWTSPKPGPPRPADTALLKTVSHLASGGKHFQQDAFDTSRLLVVMDDGSQRTALDLAMDVVHFWRQELTRKYAMDIATWRSQLRKAVEALGPDWSHKIHDDTDGDPTHEQRFVVEFRRDGQRFASVEGIDERDAIQKAMAWADDRLAGK
jgi:hypothetical protein